MDTAERGYDESKALIERWRGRGRLDYAITPRFAVTSTQAQLDAAGALAREFPRLLRPDPRQREQGGDRAGRGALSRGAELYRRLRAGRAARATLSVRPLHSFAGRAKSPRSPKAAPSPHSARRRTCFLGSGLFDQARLSAGGGADRACDRRRRGHELFDAAHGGRGLQGAAAQRPVVAGARGLLPDDAGQRPGAQSRRPDRLDRSPARRPTSSRSIRARRLRSRTGWRRPAAISRSSSSPSSRSATIARCARPMSRASRAKRRAALARCPTG